MCTQPDEVELIRIPGGIHAESIVTALRARGIPVRTRAEILGTIYGLTLDGLGEVSLFVPREYLEEAKAILTAGEHGDLVLSDSEPIDGTEHD